MGLPACSLIISSYVHEFKHIVPRAHVLIENIAQCADFVALDTIANVDTDLRYASPDNFAQRAVYAGLNCAWLHHDAAKRLREAAQALAHESPGSRLLVLDAVRPHRVQMALWETLSPDLQRYLASPAIGSLHSFGMAVDVTIIDAHGREIDMGTPFDHMSPLAHPEFEAQHLREGTLSQTQVDHRLLLRRVMTDAGFVGIDTEWWHFDATRDRAQVRANYVRVD
jgi:zinc D-Ala-D-Ala dipeptidase